MTSRSGAPAANRHYDEWTDPNLTEPKFQDDLHRRPRQRPRAARRELKSAPGDDAARQEMTQIRYFKYIPYRDMNEPERRKYLSLGPARLTSSRTGPTPRQQRVSAKAGTSQDDYEAAFWQSGSKSKSLKVYDYHLAELSLAYRSPPTLLSVPRRLVTPTNGSRQEPRRQQQRQQATTAADDSPRRSLFYQLHASRTSRASAPSETQRQLTLAEKTTQVSRGCTPFIESALSDNFPTEPGDVVSKSESNRLLNVVSVDECHVRHRRRRRRLRRVNVGLEMATDAVEAEGYDLGDDEEAECEKEGDWEEEEEAESITVGESAVEHGSGEVPTAEPPEPEQQQESDADAFVLPSVTSTRPTTERSKKSKRRSEKDMRRVAAAKFLRRSEILREKMAIYLDWKLSQERLGLAEIREGDPAARFERFTVELVRQEAMVANQYRGMGRGVSGEPVADNLADEFLSSPTPMLDTQQQRGGEATAGEDEAGVGPELSLTEMFEALKA